MLDHGEKTQPYWSNAEMPTVTSHLPQGAAPASPVLSVVIPTLNAASSLPQCVGSLAPWRTLAGKAPELIISDGCSEDDTARVAASLGAGLVTGKRGRGTQLRAGAEAARGEWLLFLHADTRLGPEWAAAVLDHIARYTDGEKAGYFGLRLDDPDPRARRIERCVAGRCRRMALPYGDQGLLIHRALYERVGGFSPVPLMEDVKIVRRLGRARLEALPARAITSGRRYRRDGYCARPTRNVTLLVLYFMGVPPRMLAKLY